MRVICSVLFIAAFIQQPSATRADVGADKLTAQRVLLEKMGKGDFSKIDEIYGPGFVVHSGKNTYSLEYDTASAKAIRQAVPDIAVSIERIVGEGPLVAVHWSARGTNTVAAAGMPGKGKTASIEGMTIFRFDKGKIVEEWSITDMLSMMRQLEMMP